MKQFTIIDYPIWQGFEVNCAMNEKGEETEDIPYFTG
jgi:hypothetical protein